GGIEKGRRGGSREQNLLGKRAETRLVVTVCCPGLDDTEPPPRPDLESGIRQYVRRICVAGADIELPGVQKQPTEQREVARSSIEVVLVGLGLAPEELAGK